MVLKGNKTKKIGRLISLQSPSRAKESAEKLLHLYRKAETKRERKMVVAAARKAAQNADNTKISRIYWAIHDHIAGADNPSPSIRQTPPSSERKSSSDSTETKPSDEEEEVTYTLDPETKRKENGERKGNESTDTKRKENETKSYRSDYHEFVSNEMENYSGIERRSGEALKEIAEKWRERKNRRPSRRNT